jgi:hypothetical protein
MAVTSTVYTATPPTGYNAGLRTALAGFLSGSWTVHPLVSFGAGITLRSYFVLEHTNGLQVMIAFFEGSSSNLGAHVFAGHVQNQWTPNSTSQMWMAIDPNGGGAASGSLYDRLNVAGDDPINASFWVQTEVSNLLRLHLVFNGSGSTSIYVVEDDADATLAFASQPSHASYTLSIAPVIISERLVDDTQRAVGDRLPTRAGIIAIGSATNAAGNGATLWEHNVFPGAVQRESRIVFPSGWNMVDANNATTDPDADGKYITQTVPIETNDGIIRGIVDTQLLLFIANVPAILGKRRQNGDYMVGPDQYAFLWTFGTGDIN